MQKSAGVIFPHFQLHENHSVNKINMIIIALKETQRPVD